MKPCLPSIVKESKNGSGGKGSIMCERRKEDEKYEMKRPLYSGEHVYHSLPLHVMAQAADLI